MKVTVVGAGHGGCAMAAVLAMRGHDVSLLKLSTAIGEDAFGGIRSRRMIRLRGLEGEGEFPLAAVSREPADVIPEADLILVYYVANYHDVVAARCAPYFHAAQTVVINPGYCGSLIMRRIVADTRRMPLFVEFETLPYSSRMAPDGSVSIVSRNVMHPFAAYPASRAQEFMERFDSVLGPCVPRGHLLEVALHNPNLVIHTAGVVLNTAQVENAEQTFAMYRDGFSPAVWSVVHQLDGEKMAVLERLGAPPISYFEEFALRTFGDSSVNGLDGFGRYAREAPDGPFSVRHRYVTEDVPIGLGLLHSLGVATNVATPIADGLLNLSNAMIPERDLWCEARTLRSLWNDSLDSLLAELTR